MIIFGENIILYTFSSLILFCCFIITTCQRKGDAGDCEKRIPFDVSIDPFYSEANMNYLKKVISDIESGKAELQEHELIED